MRFFKRISDIIAANLNDLADQYEDPETMLKQVVREMEESITDVTKQTAKAMANDEILKREMERNRAQIAQWQERAVKAVGAGDDGLASKALTRKKEYEKVASALEDQLSASREASAMLQRQLGGMKAKLAEAKRSLNTLVARKRAADFRMQVEGRVAGVTPEADESAFAAFDRLKGKVEQAEAEAEAMAELRGSSPGAAVEEMGDALDEEFDVASELAALKQKMKK
jgi:phage shock protein A